MKRDRSKESSMVTSRRDLLTKALFGAGFLGLRSLATGVPLAILADPRRALAAGPVCATQGKAQFLVFSTSGQGDALNANVPGTYEDAGIAHPLDPAMAPAPLTVGGQTYRAAAPWTTLPSSVLARTCFFHGATNTSIHPDEHKVLSLMGGVAQDEMLVSFLAAQLAPCLSTIQTEPVSLSAGNASEALVYKGRPQPLLSPLSLADTLGAPEGPLATLQSRRDADLDRLNAIMKSHGNNAQRAFIDRYAISQSQARSISQSLLTALASIKDNSPASQITAALVLIQMRVTPVIGIHLPFGGDNHHDVDLTNEADQTVASLGTLNDFFQKLAAAGLSDQVTFATLNVFGRTMSLARRGTTGRDHNPNHQCSLLIGKNVRGSVIGGVGRVDGDYGALAFDAASGRATPDGNVSPDESMASMAKTLAQAVGVDASATTQAIAAGRVVPAAVV
jgi:hypothetical protein